MHPVEVIAWSGAFLVAAMVVAIAVALAITIIGAAIVAVRRKL